MTQEQFDMLLEYIDARIAEKIEDAFGRDSHYEIAVRIQIKDDLTKLFNVKNA